MPLVFVGFGRVFLALFPNVESETISLQAPSGREKGKLRGSALPTGRVTLSKQAEAPTAGSGVGSEP